MDTFFEQLIRIKSTAKTKLAFAGIWILALALSAGCMLFLFQIIGVYSMLLVCGLVYVAYRFSLMLSVEYEYIITNGNVDIDKIIAKSSRKRIVSFDLSDVQSLERYNPANKPRGGFGKAVMACNEGDEAYSMVVQKDGGEKLLVVFAPNERMREATVKFLPKHIANSAFKD